MHVKESYGLLLKKPRQISSRFIILLSVTDKQKQIKGKQKTYPQILFLLAVIKTIRL